jgi:hypothetical protein
MSGKERRVSPRRDCVIPLRFRILANVYASAGNSSVSSLEDWPRESAGHFGLLDGEAINLSERGIGFKSREKLRVGDQVDLYLTIPRSLTGRSAEQVCCKARVVHVDPQQDLRGLRGFGAVVDRFEAVAAAAQSWAS